MVQPVKGMKVKPEVDCCGANNTGSGSCGSAAFYGCMGRWAVKISSCASQLSKTFEFTVKTGQYAFFYFSFSDGHKQSEDDLLRSLVAQMGWIEPALSMLRQAYETPERSVPERRS